MKSKIKPFPAVMTVISILYLIYVRSNEDTVLVADAVGGDPGGKLLPTILGIFMLAGFLYITIKERPDGKREEKGTIVLFLITLGVSLAYLFLLKYAGFILVSTVLVFALEYLYTTIDEERSLKDGLLGGGGTLIVTSGAYLLMRFITKSFIHLARIETLPAIFSSSVFEGCISLAFVVLLTVVFYLTICRLLKAKGRPMLAKSCLITFATVLLLFVIFKQFFNVNLAPGLLNY